MSILTDRKAFEQWYACNAFNYEHNPIGSRECGLQWAAWQAAQAALIKKLATVSVEPCAWMVEDIDRRHFIFRTAKPEIIVGETLSPLYPAEALAAARVQALEEFKADLADALCADCENGGEESERKSLREVQKRLPNS